MSWDDLTKVNIDEIKGLYSNYLSRAIGRINPKDILSFEDFLSEVDRCPVCGEYCIKKDMVYHKLDIGEVEEMICEGCRNDEDI